MRTIARLRASAGSRGASPTACSAAAAAEHAVGLAPRDPALARNLAIVRTAQGRLREAIALCRTALAGGEDAALLNTLGVALKEDGQLADAGQSLERALALQPGLDDALFNLAAVRKDQGSTDDAVALLRRLVERALRQQRRRQRTVRRSESRRLRDRAGQGVRRPINLPGIEQAEAQTVKQLGRRAMDEALLEHRQRGVPLPPITQQETDRGARLRRGRIDRQRLPTGRLRRIDPAGAAMRGGEQRQAANRLIGRACLDRTAEPGDARIVIARSSGQQTEQVQARPVLRVLRNDALQQSHSRRGIACAHQRLRFGECSR